MTDNSRHVKNEGWLTHLNQDGFTAEGGIKGQKKGDKDILDFHVIRERWSNDTRNLMVERSLFKRISVFTENQEAKLPTGNTTRDDACGTVTSTMFSIDASCLMITPRAASQCLYITSMALFTSVYSVEIVYIHDRALFKD